MLLISKELVINRNYVLLVLQLIICCNKSEDYS